jgi:magnesium chelatase subunit ChlI-like protein
MAKKIFPFRLGDECSLDVAENVGIEDRLLLQMLFVEIVRKLQGVGPLFFARLNQHASSGKEWHGSANNFTPPVRAVNKYVGASQYRQPLEDGSVCIARAAMSLNFPARFMLAAAMNPCPCGFHNDRTRECHCTPPMIQRYISKISGPLLDRIDIHIDVPAVNYKEMRSGSEPESSTRILERVISAREIQLQRFQSCREKIYSNAQMAPRHMRQFCELSADCERLLERAMTQQGLSARAHDRILKVARTIADLDHSAAIDTKHIAEAIQYRTLDRTFWA